MDRLRSIANLWNWLPAFRAVAETGNVRQAADRLHISPSALSRTVRLLEEELGQPLFDRVGRGLTLNAAGEQLLAVVRGAMRRIHDTTLAIDAQVLVGLVRISSPGTMSHAFAVPALALLRAEHPALVPVITPEPSGDPSTALLLGDVDLVLSTKPIAHADLTTLRLGASSNGVYCGRDHPLYGASTVAMVDLLAHAFVAPPADDGVPIEGWPAEVPRTIGAYVTTLWAGLQCCREGGLLAVLPDVIGRREAQGGALFRLPFEGIEALPFFACHRPTLAIGGRAEAALAAIVQVVERELRGTQAPAVVATKS